MGGSEIRWDIRLLGGLQVLRGDRSVSTFRSERTALLLARLAYPPLRRHDRGVLAESIWDDVPGDRARHSLSQSLYSLRKAIEVGLGAESGALILTEGRDGLLLDAQRVEVDVARFLRAAEDVPAADDHRGARAALKRMLDAYPGVLLPSIDTPWVSTERRNLARRARQARMRLSELAEREGNADEALRLLGAALSDDLLDEVIAERYIRALVRAGQTAQALRTFDRLASALEEDLGTEPDPSLAEWIRGLRAGETPHRSPQGGRDAALPPDGLLAGTITVLVTSAPVQDDPDSPGGDGAAPSMAEAGETQSDTRADDTSADGTWPIGSRNVIARRGGWVIPDDDRCAALFGRATDAASAARAILRRLRDGERAGRRAQPPGETLPRMALQLAEVQAPDRDGTNRDEEQHPWIDPLTEAAELLEAARSGHVLCSRAAAAVLEAAGEPCDDLGWWRLPNTRETRRILCLSGTGGGAKPRGVPAAAGLLPLRLDRFFGRATELERLLGLVRSPDARLITLTGMGGAGKTRLALEAADRLLGDFAGAIWFAPLADVESVDSVPDAIVRSLGLRRERGLDPMRQASAHLSEQPSLLLIDNVEHLLPVAASPIRQLLELTPTLTVLATSRRPLEIAGERRMALDPLPIPDTSDRSLPEIAANPSARILYDRAQLARPEFLPRAEEAADMAWICRRLEGIPLALELAAARMKLMTPAEVRRNLTDRFEFLRDDRPDRPSRHRTLLDAIDWSTRLLSAEGRLRLARLSVFRGGWTHDAAAAVFDERQSLDGLAELVDASLIRVETSERTLRYTMYETIREFADRRLSERHRVDAAYAHLQSCRELAEEAAPELTGPDLNRWLRRMDAERDNFRIALRRAIQADFWSVPIDATDDGDSMGTPPEDMDPVREGLRLAGALWRYWFLRGLDAEGRGYLEQLLETEAPPMPEETGPWASAHHAAGTLAFYLNQLVAARQHFLESLRLHQYLDDPGSMAYTINNLGMVEARLGNREAALEAFEESLAIKRKLGDEKAVANTLFNLAREGEPPEGGGQAREWAEEALAIAQRTGHRWLVQQAWTLLAVIDANAGNPERALQRARAAAAAAKSIDDPRGQSEALRALSGILTTYGRFEEARFEAERALEFAEQTGDPELRSYARAYLAYALLGLEDFQAALGASDASVEIARTEDLRQAEANGLIVRSLVNTLTGDAPDDPSDLVRAHALDTGRTPSIQRDLIGLLALRAHRRGDHRSFIRLASGMLAAPTDDYRPYVGMLRPWFDDALAAAEAALAEDEIQQLKQEGHASGIPGTLDAALGLPES